MTTKTLERSSLTALDTKLTGDDLIERLQRPKTAQAFVDALLDTAIQARIADDRIEELSAKISVVDCGHKALRLPPEEGPADGCTAMAITINGVTRVYCECAGIAEGAY